MFEKIAGNGRAREFLERQVLSGSLGLAYLFTGPEGVGKRLIACEIVRYYCCQAPLEKPCGKCAACLSVNAGSFPDFYLLSRRPDKKDIVIDDVREAQKFASVRPVFSLKKFIIIDDAQYLNVNSANALLKLLEDGPEYLTVFIITSSPLKILTTIRSRCQNVRFSGIEPSEMEEHLKTVGIEMPPAEKAAVIAFSGSSISAVLRLINDSGMISDLMKIREAIDSGRILKSRAFFEDYESSREETVRLMSYLVRGYGSSLDIDDLGKAHSLACAIDGINMNLNVKIAVDSMLWEIRTSSRGGLARPENVEKDGE